MTEVKQPKIISLFDKFVNEICSQTSPLPVKFQLLSEIKNCVLQNPNNYHHFLNGNATFIDIYEFVIECLSHVYENELANYIIYTLALIVKSWVVNIEDFKQIYNGILDLYQSRKYIASNCFYFLTVLIETMQEEKQMQEKQTVYKKKQQTVVTNIAIVRMNMQNFFANHMLNQFLAFANLNLQRSVIRNERPRSIKMVQERRSSQNFQEKVRISQSDSSTSYEEDFQMFLIRQDFKTIFSILSLIRACLTYDFMETIRNNPQSDFDQSRSPIILPTKFSKFSRFSEFDIFLKNQNTTQMLNYLYLVCNNISLKMQILQILKAMARIHFRYFKNKTIHKVHLQNIGYVVANLMTGMELSQTQIESQSIKNTIGNTNDRIGIIIMLSQIVGLLLYHQPTFYFAESSLIQMIIEHIQNFIENQVLDVENFVDQSSVQKIQFEIYGTKNLNINDLALVIESYMGQIFKLTDLFNVYLSNNQVLVEKLNQFVLKIGQKYQKILTTNHRNSPSLFRSPNKDYSKKQKFIQDKPFSQDTFCNSKNNSNEKIVIFNDSKTPENKIEQSVKKSLPANCKIKNYRFLNQIYSQNYNIHEVSSVLSIFRVYCPKYISLGIVKQKNINSEKQAYINSLIQTLQNANDLKPNQNLNTNTDENLQVSANKNKHYKQKQKPNIKIYSWMASWLCNFQHDFYLISGQNRHSQAWEIQITIQLTKQIISDLICLIEFANQKGIKILQQLIEECQLKQINECIKVCLLYLIQNIQSKIIYNEEAIKSLYFDKNLIFQWVSNSIFNNTINLDGTAKLLQYIYLNNNKSLKISIKKESVMQILKKFEKYFKQNTTKASQDLIFVNILLNSLQILANNNQNVNNEQINLIKNILIQQNLLFFCSLIAQINTDVQQKQHNLFFFVLQITKQVFDQPTKIISATLNEQCVLNNFAKSLSHIIKLFKKQRQIDTFIFNKIIQCGFECIQKYKQFVEKCQRQKVILISYLLQVFDFLSEQQRKIIILQTFRINWQIIAKQQNQNLFCEQQFYNAFLTIQQVYSFPSYLNQQIQLFYKCEQKFKKLKICQILIFMLHNLQKKQTDCLDLQNFQKTQSFLFTNMMRIIRHLLIIPQQLVNQNQNMKQYSYQLMNRMKTEVLSVAFAYLIEKMQQQAYSNSQKQVKKYLKIDNIISTLIKYHNVLQFIIQLNPQIIWSLPNQFIKHCILNLQKNGVAWVTRKLQIWDNQEFSQYLQAKQTIEINQNNQFQKQKTQLNSFFDEQNTNFEQTTPQFQQNLDKNSIQNLGINVFDEKQNQIVQQSYSHNVLNKQVSQEAILKQNNNYLLHSFNKKNSTNQDTQQFLQNNTNKLENF